MVTNRSGQLGNRCGRSNRPGANTLIPFYADWITEKTAGDVLIPEFFVQKYGSPPLLSSFPKPHELVTFPHCLWVL